MENKSHALAAGVFVIVLAALLAGLILWLTRDRTHYTLYELSSRESVSGLQSQAAVRYKGVAVGKVTNIGFDSKVPGNVLIRIAVNAEAPITPATYAVLGYQGVTGLAHILLDDADTPQPALPPGPSGVPRLPLQTSPFGRLAEQTPAILGQVQQAAERVNKLLNDDNQARLGTALTNIGQAAGQIAQLGRRLEPALATAPALATQALYTLQELQQASASIDATAADVAKTVQHLNAPGGAIDQFAQSSQSLARAVDGLGRTTLPRVDRAADAVARAARQIGQVAGGIGDNPQSLIYGPALASPGPGESGFTPPPPTH